MGGDPAGARYLLRGDWPRLPFLILTLGLFTFVLNALMLWLTSAASDLFSLRFRLQLITQPDHAVVVLHAP